MLGVQTYVLVLLFGINNVAVVPGYGSRAECDAAVRIVESQPGTHRGKAFCVPGPVEVK